MRRTINNYGFGWANGKPNLSLNAKFVNSAFIKVLDNTQLYFDIEFDKSILEYTITHNMYFEYPWCGTYVKFNCGTYKTQKNENTMSKDDNIKKLIIDWFVGMYGSDELLKEYFGENYMLHKEEKDNLYMNEYSKNFTITSNAMTQFKKDFNL